MLDCSDHAQIELKHGAEIIAADETLKDSTLKAYCIDTSRGEIRPVPGIQERAKVMYAFSH